MSGPLPAASSPVPPALLSLPLVNPKTGIPTLTGGSFLTQLWAALAGSGGVGPTVAELVVEVAIIFNMHGDGTLSPTGELIVTKTNGTAFSYFATGTDAANLTGTLNAARIADNSLAYAKLANAAGPELLGATAAGPVVAITVGRGLALAANILTATDGPAVLVANLGPPTACFRAFVSDSSVVAAGNFGNVVAGGGANFAPVYATGIDWRIG